MIDAVDDKMMINAVLKKSATRETKHLLFDDFVAVCGHVKTLRQLHHDDDVIDTLN